MGSEEDERAIRAEIERRSHTIGVTVDWMTPSGRRRSVPVYVATVRNSCLNEVRTVQGKSDAEVRGKAKNLLLKWDEQEIRQRIAAAKTDARDRAKDDAERANQSLQETLTALGSLLPAALKTSPRLEWAELMDTAPFPPFSFEPPHPVQPPSPLPSSIPKPSFWEWLLPSLKRRRLALEAEILQGDQEKARAHEERWQSQVRAWEEARKKSWESHWRQKARYEEGQAERNREVEDFRRRFDAGEASAIEEYVRGVFERSTYPDCFPREYTAVYDAPRGTLVVDVMLPPQRAIPSVAEYRYVARGDEVRPTAMKKADHRALFEAALVQATLRTAYEAFHSLYTNHTKAISVRAWVRDLDPATGQEETRRVHALYATREQFFAVNLQHVDAKACLDRLGTEPSRMVPDRPPPRGESVPATAPERPVSYSPPEPGPGREPVRVEPLPGTVPLAVNLGYGLRVEVKVGGSSLTRGREPEEDSVTFDGVGFGTRSKKEGKAREQDCWVPPGSSVRIGGRELPGGGYYFGEGLPSLSSEWDAEPALIDPKLPANFTSPDRAGATMSYWPSYSTLTPAARAAHIEWMEQGRNDPGIGIGHVFLHFYGIERRILGDRSRSATLVAETRALLDEVRRLRELNGSNGSFRSYSGQFLDFVEFILPAPEAAAPSTPLEGRGWGIPPRLKKAIGTFISEGKPLPGEWAFAWLLHHPEVRFRTPARRCPEEFRKIFLIRYSQAYAEGLRVAARSVKWRVEYNPACSGIPRPQQVVVDGLPDIDRLSRPIHDLAELADRCADELDAYSRFVNRSPRAAGTLAAAALLPEGLVSPRETAGGKALLEWVDTSLAGKDHVVVEGKDLFARWPGVAGNKLRKADAVALAQVLEREGIGLEPDVRFGGAAPGKGEKVVLFRETQPSLKAPTPSYLAGSLLLRLASVVAAADGAVSPEEMDHLEEHLESSMDFSPPERTRLRAHLRHLAASPPGMGGVKKRLIEVPEGQRDLLANLLVSVAGADGRFEPAEVKVLGQLFKAMGLPEQEVFSRAHAHASRPTAPDVGPVSVFVAGAPARTFAVPQPPASEKPADVGRVTIDMEAVEVKLRETAAVASLLSGIFASEECEAPAAPEPAESVQEDLVEGFDAAHSRLLRGLAAKPQWSRPDLERVASEVGLLPDGALDVLNETALERCGEPLCEGDDPIDVNAVALSEFLR